MLTLLKNILGIGPKLDLNELKASGAVVIDVRTPAEYKDGHVKGSINLPLQTLNNNLNKLQKDQVIITCCRSGSRSGMAKRMLKANGFEQVHNGGAWTSLKA